MVFIWNPARTVWISLEYPHSHRLTLMVNVLQLQSMLQLEGPKATLTCFLQSSPQPQNPLPETLFPLPRPDSYSLCALLYLECIVNTVNANMVLQDKKQLWTEVKCKVVLYMTCTWAQSDGAQAFQKNGTLDWHVISFDGLVLKNCTGEKISTHPQICVDVY